ncbi:MAG: PorT family protein [Saprospiraceae bacterium]|nr:PorT family protein [Saprospiraceae bacterium]
MKKLSILIVLLAATVTAFAQARFNPKVGPSFSYYNSDGEDTEIKGKTGFVAGFDLRFGETFYFAPGAYYFQQKNQVDEIGPFDISGDNFEFTTRGIRIPLVVGGDLVKSEALGIRVYTGPNISFIFEDEDEFADFEELFLNETIWGYNLGAGVDFGIVSIDLNHEWGLTNIFDSDTIDSRNHRLYLMVGILF